MLTNRSMCVAFAAVLALSSSSCLYSQRVHHEHALAVKAEAETDLVHAQTEAVRETPDSPEYVEAESAPEIPAAFPEERPAAPSPAHVWIAGHHARRAGAWLWVAGHYALPPQADEVWVTGHWVPHLQGWVWIGGAWR